MWLDDLVLRIAEAVILVEVVGELSWEMWVGLMVGEGELARSSTTRGGHPGGSCREIRAAGKPTRCTSQGES